MPEVTQTCSLRSQVCITTGENLSVCVVRPSNGPQVIAWFGKLMALARNEPFDPDKPAGAMRTKERFSAYRGATCGVGYAEAFRSAKAYPQEIL